VARLISKHAAALAFAVLISLPLVLLGHPALLGAALSESREPSAFPTQWSARYLERVGDFFNDYHGFRNALVLLGSRVMPWLGVTSSHPSVVVGEKGWLFFTDDSSDRGRATMKDFRGRSRLAPERVAEIRRNLENLGREFGRCRIGFALWLIPNKQSIYGEHLTGFKEAKEGKRIDQVVAALSGVKGMLLVDGRSPLLAKKDLGVDLYFRTDTHWNNLGALVSYEALFARLTPALGLPKRDAGTERYGFATVPFTSGDLAANMLFAPWRFPDTSVNLVPLFTRSAVGKRYDAPARPAPPDALSSLVYAWTNPAAGGSVLYYGDSFAERTIPYIQERFGRGHLLLDNIVDGRAVGSLKPDLVILEIVERHVDWLAAPPRNLEEFCGT
jgi:hypothetical protein